MFDNLYRDLLESGSWALSEIDEADYYFLLHLFNGKSSPKKEKKQDPLDFFSQVLSPQDLAKAKGEIQ